MKIRFGLITFYQGGFVLLHNIQGNGERNDLWINVTSTNTNGIYCVVKTMLKLMFIEMA